MARDEGSHSNSLELNDGSTGLQVASSQTIEKADFEAIELSKENSGLKVACSQTIERADFEAINSSDVSTVDTEAASVGKGDIPKLVLKKSNNDWEQDFTGFIPTGKPESKQIKVKPLECLLKSSNPETVNHDDNTVHKGTGEADGASLNVVKIENVVTFNADVEMEGNVRENASIKEEKPEDDQVDQVFSAIGTFVEEDDQGKKGSCKKRKVDEIDPETGEPLDEEWKPYLFTKRNWAAKNRSKKSQTTPQSNTLQDPDSNPVAVVKKVDPKYSGIHLDPKDPRKNWKELVERGLVNPDNETCVKCGYKSKYTRGDLIKHIKRIHLREKKVVCKSCKKRFSNRQEMIVHYKRNHKPGGNRPIKPKSPATDSQDKDPLDESSNNDALLDGLTGMKRWNSSSEWRELVKKNLIDDAKEVCTVCSYKSKHTRGDLVKHVRRVHLKIKTVRCPSCDMAFPSEAEMIRHHKGRHGTTPVKFANGKPINTSEDHQTSEDKYLVTSKKDTSNVSLSRYFEDTFNEDIAKMGPTGPRKIIRQERHPEKPDPRDGFTPAKPVRKLSDYSQLLETKKNTSVSTEVKADSGNGSKVTQLVKIAPNQVLQDKKLVVHTLVNSTKPGEKKYVILRKMENGVPKPTVSSPFSISPPGKSKVLGTTPGTGRALVIAPGKLGPPGPNQGKVFVLRRSTGLQEAIQKPVVKTSPAIRPTIPIKIAPAVTQKSATQTITKPRSPIKVEVTGDVVMSIGERAKLRKEMSAVDPLSPSLAPKTSLAPKSVSSTTKESATQPLRKSPRKQIKVENQTPTT